MKRVGRAPALAAAVLIAAASAAAEPWHEGVMSRHVDQDALSGTLDKAALEALRERGEELFVGHFTPADGVGRPFATQAIVPTKRKRPPENAFFRSAGLDANACAGCHNLPATGGAGDFVTNVFVSEGFESADFDSLDPQFSNERGTNHLFGAGLIELLAREMTVDLQRMRREALAKARRQGSAVTARLASKGVDFGVIVAEPDGMLDLSAVAGVDHDLVIRPFSQKGVMTSLRQFTVNALNHHHGMQASERFGPRWTGERDHDGDGVEDEVSEGDVSALVAWQAGLKPPVERTPDGPEWQAAARKGSAVFDALGCNECHRRALPLQSLSFADPGPLDMAGTLRGSELAEPAVYDLALLDWARGLPRNGKGAVLVPLFGDLKRHTIADQEVAALGNELLAQRFVERNVFMTAELWGAGSTAPYGHRNDLSTLDEVIRAHGGEGRAARDRYVEAAEEERGALIAFLRTLVIGP
ncbi:di-heme oxidoredictase family protein [Chelativorans xinjiangense]|uniref:di-heme oxidoredictase family protein n=1 Tax=Chelativorans xinjiangense TaxID=2681485 RepID=UPI00135C2D5D|nr:di-heme oxidoredictase family protein [Chelativorans xinjiangense]